MRKILAALPPALLAAQCVSADPALTIYNQDFAVVRDTIHLDLKSGVNSVNYSGATAHLEPDSVVLRDPAGHRDLQILEQNFRADPISEGLLLNYYEGKTIDFEVDDVVGGVTKKETVRGKIVRSGYVPHVNAFNQYGYDYSMGQQNMAEQSQPIVEVNGKLMFRLPGQPLFPTLPDDSILKPTLTWEINADQGGPVEAELGYVTGGMSWHADYNLVAPENGDTMDLVGWVTMDNQSGKSFSHAKIKLMAGDVNKIQPNRFNAMYTVAGAMDMVKDKKEPVTEKAFDEYHLYTLERPATLLDRETKQVEFVTATGIPSKTIYIYDGMRADRWQGWNWNQIREQNDYGTDSSPKVAVVREFFNSTTNHLGMPLPKGRLRFYRRDDDGQMEFTGENEIDHTPRNERIRVTTGAAFDLTGERTRTDFKEETRDRWIDESFQIKVRNHKKEPVEIRVVEHLNRWNNWNITAKSEDFTKTDAQTMEFRVNVEPEGEHTVTYTVHYSW